MLSSPSLQLFEATEPFIESLYVRECARACLREPVCESLSARACLPEPVRMRTLGKMQGMREALVGLGSRQSAILPKPDRDLVRD